jgi:EF hand
VEFCVEQHRQPRPVQLALMFGDTSVVVSLLAAQWFRAIDRDGNGTLDSMELQRALALGNLHFSLQATSHMIRCGRPVAW